MDEDTANGLKNFDKVWSRVTGSAPSVSARRQDDAADLREFICGEKCDAAFYMALARRAGKMSRVFINLASDERAHMKELQVEHFFLTGDTCVPAEACPVPSGMLASIRRAYHNEIEGSRRYLAAAEKTGSDRLKELYKLYASEEAGHAEVLRDLISRIM